MDLRQLGYLVAVGDEGGMRAAARRLQIAQPQISEALRRLEGELGVQLMRRSTRGIELTAEGHELMTRGRDILARVDEARVALSQMAVGQSARLRVGVVAGVLGAGELLSPILAEYRRIRPDVALQILDIGFDQIGPLLDAAIDVAIVRTPMNQIDFEVTPIAQEARVVMVGATHDLAGAETVNVDDVLSYPMLPLEAEPSWTDFWQLNDERGGPNVDPQVSPARNVPEAQFAIATGSVMITSPAVLARLAPNPLIRPIPLRDAAPTVIAVARKRRDTRSTVQCFVEAARATAVRDITLMPDASLPEA